MEACDGSHYWARRLSARLSTRLGARLSEMGHQVRLIPPHYVKPVIRRGKDDRNDAGAICQAAGRPCMAMVPAKSADRQANAMIPSVREQLARQRTQAINARHRHPAELGVVAVKGTANVAAVMERVAVFQAAVPEAAQQMLTVLADQVAHLDEEIAALGSRLKALAARDAAARRLARVPGIGWVGAITLSLTVDAPQCRDGRHFASWLGLVPEDHSTGGKRRLGCISRAGDERLRQVLVVGGMAVGRHAKPDAKARASKSASPWLLTLLERRPR